MSVSGGILAALLQDLIQSSVGVNGTDNSVLSFMPVYETFNFQVKQGSREENQAFSGASTLATVSDLCGINRIIPAGQNKFAR